MSANNILIRNLSDTDNANLSELQKHFCVGTNSQAVLKVVGRYMSLHNENRQLRASYNEAKQQLREYEQFIGSLRASVNRFHPDDDSNAY